MKRPPSLEGRREVELLRSCRRSELIPTRKMFVLEPFWPPVLPETRRKESEEKCIL